MYNQDDVQIDTEWIRRPMDPSWTKFLKYDTELYVKVVKVERPSDPNLRFCYFQYRNSYLTKEEESEINKEALWRFREEWLPRKVLKVYEKLNNKK
jgi:hypothetical protein